MSSDLWDGQLPDRGLGACAGAKAGALWQLVYRPVVLLEQPGSCGSQNPRLQLFPEGEAPHCFLSQPFLCAGVWDQKQWAEDSQGFGAPVWASVAPEHDRTSVEGTPPLAPTGLAPGTYRATEAQLQPVCCAPGLGSRGRNGAPRLGTCVCPGASQKHKCCPPGHELATR